MDLAAGSEVELAAALYAKQRQERMRVRTGRGGEEGGKLLLSRLPSACSPVARKSHSVQDRSYTLLTQWERVFCYVMEQEQKHAFPI